MTYGVKCNGRSDRYATDQGMLMKTPDKITDVIQCDGQQSILATRISTSDVCTIAAGMDNLGFYTIEGLGGATFDVAARKQNKLKPGTLPDQSFTITNPLKSTVKTYPLIMQ
jgi:pyruvate/oxaloacetate carboxyltransferase